MERVKKSKFLITALILNSFLFQLSVNSTEIELKRIILGSNKVKSADQTSSSSISDWPMHHYNAQHTGYNDHSTISVPPIFRWAITDTLTKGGPVTVVNGRVILTYGKPFEDHRIACLDANDGSPIWIWLIDEAADITQAAYGYGNVYVEVMNHTSSFMVAFDLETGDTLWRTGLRSQWDHYLSPTIHEGRVLYGTGFYGGFGCMDAFTGKILWTVLGTSADWFTPAAYEDTVYAFIEQKLWVGDLYTGNRYWSINADTIVKAKYRPPGDALIEAMGVSPVIDTVDKIAYCMDAFNHFLFAFDLSQKSVLWIDSLVPHGYGKTPTIFQDNLYVTQWNYVQAYNRFTGEKLWQFSPNDSLRNAPIVANGYLFVSSWTNTYALNLNTMQVNWSYPIGGQITVTDNQLFISDTIWWNLYAFGDIYTSVEDEESPVLPTDFALHQNFPNPFNPSTEIEFTIPVRSHVKVSIYNSIGQLVSVLVNSSLPPGNHTVFWTGTDQYGKESPSGVYFYKLIAGDFVDSKKMILLK